MSLFHPKNFVQNRHHVWSTPKLGKSSSVFTFVVSYKDSCICAKLCSTKASPPTKRKVLYYVALKLRNQMPLLRRCFPFNNFENNVRFMVNENILEPKHMRKSSQEQIGRVFIISKFSVSTKQRNSNKWTSDSRKGKFLR